jgi:exopolysaccharide biosynthesis protein
MRERHPRTAIGWDDRFFYLVVVDGRQRTLSRGMTLAELGAYMHDLGCLEAMNLDGGGSATLWCGGYPINSPCDGMQREIANGLVVIRKDSALPATGAATAAK